MVYYALLKYDAYRTISFFYLRYSFLFLWLIWIYLYYALFNHRIRVIRFIYSSRTNSNCDSWYVNYLVCYKSLSVISFLLIRKYNKKVLQEKIQETVSIR